MTIINVADVNKNLCVLLIARVQRDANLSLDDNARLEKNEMSVIWAEHLTFNQIPVRFFRSLFFN